MPINNFKLFDEKKANMMSDDDYATNQQRLNGVQSGVASSQLQNKTLYQTALMCYALAQLMAANGYDANDADAVSTFVNNLSLSMVQKVVDKASANDVANQIAGKWVDAKQLGDLKTDVADNYLPLLGGTMLGDLILHSDPTQSLQAATKKYVDTKDLKLFTGQYTGTGQYGYRNPTSITFPFVPIILIGPVDVDANQKSINISNYMKTSYEERYWFGYYIYLKISENKKTISWYSSSDANQQLNTSGKIYYYAAIGGYDMGDKIPVGTTFTIISSESWRVPATGRYMLELYGMGGNGFGTRSLGASGGSSCQHYDSITLTKGDIQQIVIGDYSNPATKFGSYSVNNGGNASYGTGGLGSGNYGKNGIAGSDVPSTLSNGALSGRYGDGGSWSAGSAAPGAVYLKYLGD